MTERNIRRLRGILTVNEAASYEAVVKHFKRNKLASPTIEEFNNMQKNIKQKDTVSKPIDIQQEIRAKALLYASEVLRELTKSPPALKGNEIKKSVRS